MDLEKAQKAILGLTFFLVESDHRGSAQALKDLKVAAESLQALRTKSEITSEITQEEWDALINVILEILGRFAKSGEIILSKFRS